MHYGGDFFGHKPYENDIKRYGEFGYVCEIDNSSIADVGVDEDSIGENLWMVLTKQKTLSTASILTKYSSLMTENQYKKLIDGDYATFAVVGKKIAKKLTDAEVIALLESGDYHLAHNGKLTIKKCFSFSRYDTAKIKPDGSNFFDFAVEYS